jgi:hypothetical protein
MLVRHHDIIPPRLHPPEPAIDQASRTSHHRSCRLESDGHPVNEAYGRDVAQVPASERDVDPRNLPPRLSLDFASRISIELRLRCNQSVFQGARRSVNQSCFSYNVNGALDCDTK